MTIVDSPRRPSDHDGAMPDCAWAAFTERGPWVLHPDHITWMPVTSRLRAAARAEVPALTESGRVPNVGRMAVVIWRLGTAVGGWWVRKRLGRFSTDEASKTALSRRLRLAIEQLGATYIKLAQIISSGEGLFPAELVNEFKRCRDRVPADNFEVVRQTIESDLGCRLEDVFAHVEPVALAAASIAQVHCARLLDGTEVVVKVQRPEVARLVRTDLKIMSWLAPHLVGRIPVAALANPPALVELFAETIVEELDFRMEAANMVDVGRVLHDLGQDGYVVPRPHPELVGRRTLVMERMDGFNFDDVDGMHAAGIDTESVIRTGMVAFMEGALIHGIFHGDLHGGNLMVLPDGRTALLDFGITARLDDDRRRAFLRMMITATTNDLTGQMAALRDLGALPQDTDLAAVIHDLRLDQEPIDPTTLTGEEMVAEVQRLVKALLGYGARMPKELMLYVKNMVFLDGAIARLAPDLDLLAEVAAISMLFAQRHGERIMTEIGIDAARMQVDLDSVKAGLGVDLSTERLTYRELQERRALIQKRMRAHVDERRR